MWRENRHYSTPRSSHTLSKSSLRLAFCLYVSCYNYSMTSNHEYSGLNTNSSDPFDDLWEATHPKGTASWEEDDDIPDYDREVSEE